MQNVYKKFVILSISFPCIFMFVFLVWLYLYDPLQLFHKPIFRDATFFHDLRSQNRGIIKNYDFNSVILGTSMLENTLPKDANMILQNLDSINNANTGGGGEQTNSHYSKQNKNVDSNNIQNLQNTESKNIHNSQIPKSTKDSKNNQNVIESKTPQNTDSNADSIKDSKKDSKNLKFTESSKNIFVNLSMWGSTFNEREVILRYLLKQKVIKNIIYSLDWWVFSYENDASKFDFLYTNNIDDLLKMYVNEKNLKCARKWSRSEACVGKKFDIYNESIVAWMDDDSMQYFGGLQNFIKSKGNREAKNLPKKPLEMGNITKSSKSPAMLSAPFIEILKSNSKTQFHIILPTYPRLFWALQGEKFFKSWQQNILHFLNETASLPNVRIYGFDELDYADNIANFKDIQHYSPQLNVLQLHAIATHTHILNLQNIESYFATMQEKIKNYDTTPFLKATENME